jgi:hypothetical protein
LVINTLQYDARYTQPHINTLQYDARYTQPHINTLQYDARYTQHQNNNNNNNNNYYYYLLSHIKKQWCASANTKVSAVHISYINPKFYTVNEILILNSTLVVMDLFLFAAFAMSFHF